MGSLKKNIIQTSHRATAAVLESMSKAALADLVIDLVRLNRGDESLEGRRLAEAIVDAARPVLDARCDSTPRPTVFFDKMAPDFAERHRDRIREIRDEWDRA